MKNDFKRALCIWLLPIFLWGCCPSAEKDVPRSYRVITEIHVLSEGGSAVTQRHYFHQRKIQQILNYLRTIDPYGAPEEDPAQISGNDFYIFLLYSDGSVHTYQQRADQYMRIDSGRWKKIDPQKAMLLGGILTMMSSDPTPTDDTPVLPPQHPHI